jgi:hypothetical protein
MNPLKNLARQAMDELKKYLLLTFIFSLSVLACINTSSTVHASNNRGLIISPITNDLDVEKGQAYEYNLNLENDTDSYKYNLEVSKQSFAPSETDGVPELVDFPANNNYSNWLTFEKDSLSIDPTQKYDLKVRLNIPSDAKAGGYYFAIILADNPNQSDLNSSGVKITQRMVSLLFVNVKGKVERIIKFQNLQSNQSIYDPFFDQIMLKYKIRVEGGSYTKPSGNVFLNNGNEPGKTVFPLNPEEKIILPGSARTIELTSPANLGWFGFSSVVAYAQENVVKKTSSTNFPDWQKPIFGSQNIEARVVYIDSDGKISQQSSNIQVYFFPWKTLLLVLIPVVLIWVTVRYIKSKRESF